MIRITKQADYAIVLLSRFARAAPGAVLSSRDLSEACRLPHPTATKVLKVLTRAGILTSQRGIHGGYVLARPPEAISVTEIVTAVDGPIAITLCSDNAEGCEREVYCAVRGSWRVIDHAVRRALSEVTLRDMAGPAGGAEAAPCDAEKLAAAVRGALLPGG